MDDVICDRSRSREYVPIDPEEYSISVNLENIKSSRVQMCTHVDKVQVPGYPFAKQKKTEMQ